MAAEEETDRDALLAQAMRWLARREYSVHELGQRLRDKGYAAADVAGVLEALQESLDAGGRTIAVGREAAREL